MRGAWYRLRSAVAEGSERIKDRGMKGVEGEAELCGGLVQTAYRCGRRKRED